MIFKKFLIFYRFCQYRIYGRHQYGVMPVGNLCHHIPFRDEVEHGDIVHPCVRFIPEGYLGHRWWMVYTPYYQSNNKIENPVICYAEQDGHEPPTSWVALYQVQGQPEEGYNSDPVLLYDDGELYVMWRENFTPRCKEANLARATFGALVGDASAGEVFGPLVGTPDSEVDMETSPTFVVEQDGHYRCLAMHLRFLSNRFNDRLKLLPSPLRWLVSKWAFAAELMGFWSQYEHFGMAVWSSDKLQSGFHYDETLTFSNRNRLYLPWHMDFFRYEGRLYAIVQSNMNDADIVLAESQDGRHFKLYDKPLMTNDTCGKMGMYKATGGVVDGKFFLYYTAQDKDNVRLNKLYLTTCAFRDLIQP